jgi:leucyl-tRNA synthetase
MKSTNWQIATTRKSLAVEREALAAAIRLLSPIAPHMTHALWHELGHSEAVIHAAWPTVMKPHW